MGNEQLVGRLAGSPDLPLVDSAVATARTMPGSLKRNSDKAHKKTRVLLSDNS